MSGQTNWIDRMLCYLNAGEPWIVSVRDCAQYHNAVMALRAELAAAIKQRDEARRMICEDESYNHKCGVTPREVAEDRGWDCFKGGGA